jgi:secreted Zn-dependent insulinase-like peptidase
MPDAIRHLTLANGLQLTLRHAPRLKRSAAALRVHAGSHDAPAKWPGLAHFLEHLFFLGTPRFPLEDGLMRYVQALGGQVNASTRERTTDFFFEVPPNTLGRRSGAPVPDAGRTGPGHRTPTPRTRSDPRRVHRLVAQPAGPAAVRLAAVGVAKHPLGAFHAGNRYTLALQDAAFQQALAGFHQRFYQGGQIT